MPKNDFKMRNRARIPAFQLTSNNDVPLPPRNAIKKAGVEFLVGFETEFILLKNAKSVEPVNRYAWSIERAFASGTIEAQVLEEIADALVVAGVELQQYHAEAAPGQYEIVTGPLPPLQAADALVHTRNTIYNIASKHGLRATLAPRIFLDSCMFISFKSRVNVLTIHFHRLLQAAARHTRISRFIHQTKLQVLRLTHI
jgi:glutamine synthetase